MAARLVARERLRVRLGEGTCALYGDTLIPARNPLADAALKNKTIAASLQDNGTVVSVPVDDMIKLEYALISTWDTLDEATRDRYLSWRVPPPPASAVWEHGATLEPPVPPTMLEKARTAIRKIVPPARVQRALNTPRFIAFLPALAQAVLSGACHHTRIACDRTWILMLAQHVGNDVPHARDTVCPRMLVYRRLENVRARRASYCGFRQVSTGEWCWVPANHAVLQIIMPAARATVPILGLGECVCLSTTAVRRAVVRLESDAAAGDLYSLQLVVAELSRLPPSVEGYHGGGAGAALGAVAESGAAAVAAGSFVPVTIQMPATGDADDDDVRDDDDTTWRLCGLLRGRRPRRRGPV